MLIAGQLLGELQGLLDGASGGLRVVSAATDVEPIHLVRAGARAFGPSVYFGVPGGDELGGLGVAWQASASGPDRLRRLEAAIAARQLPADVRVAVGFSFADDGSAAGEWEGYPPATALLPAVSIVKTVAGSRLVVALPAGA